MHRHNGVVTNIHAGLTIRLVRNQSETLATI